MSWFSNRFATSVDVAGVGDGDHDNASNSHGKGLKEDLSELSKTFTRQLWGVASFLAPPPSTRSAAEEADPIPSFPNCHIQPGTEVNSFSQPSEMSLSHKLVDVDFQESMDPVTQLQEEVLDPPDTSRRSLNSLSEEASRAAPDHGLTGIGKDLAELKGSVATGFSKLLKVVQEEVDRSEHEKMRYDHDYNEEEDHEANGFIVDDGDEPKMFGHARKIPVLNSLLKPFLNGVLQHSSDDMPEESGTDDDHDDDDDKSGHKKSRPSGALNLGRTLGESLGSVSKIASSLFSVNLDSDDEQCAVEKNPNFQAAGVTEEVLTFAKNISMHPETWLDFPLFTEDDADDDVDMSDAQRAHIQEVERASPRLAALRIELCPDYMTEGRFWKIYFVLLHSRLNKKDAMLLSTPQIMKARSLLLNNLQKEESQRSASKNDQQLDQKKGDTSGPMHSFKVVSLKSALEIPAKDFDQTENLGANQGRHQASGCNMGDMSDEVQNKNVLANTVKLATSICEEEEADVDRWLHEESSLHFSMPTSTRSMNDEDVSFSDLEEDDDSLASKGVGCSSSKGTHGWVELNNDQKRKEYTPGKGKLNFHEKSELASKKQDRRESSDWLTVEEELDFA